MTATGWKLAEASRDFLIDLFPPRWPDLVADHVTLDAKATMRSPPPGRVAAEVVGHGDDGSGLEALVVAIGGSPDRPDGGTFHITWSLDLAQGRHAAESNDLLARKTWRRLSVPVAIDLIPARF